MTAILGRIQSSWQQVNVLAAMVIPKESEQISYCLTACETKSAPGNMISISIPEWIRPNH